MKINTFSNFLGVWGEVSGFSGMGQESYILEYLEFSTYLKSCQLLVGSI